MHSNQKAMPQQFWDSIWSVSRNYYGILIILPCDQFSLFCKCDELLSRPNAPLWQIIAKLIFHSNLYYFAKKKQITTEQANKAEVSWMVGLLYTG